MSRQFGRSVAWVAFVSLLPSIQALAIYKGNTDGDGWDKTVFMLLGGGIDNISTGTAVKRDRCLLTSSLVSGLSIKAGVDPKNDPLALTQDRERAKQRAVGNWDGLQVLWMKNLKGQLRIEEGRDYSPIPIGLLGMGSVQVTNELLDYPKATKSTGAPKAIVFRGYGNNNTDPFNNHTGIGIRRNGFGHVDYFFQGSLQTGVPPRDGSFFIPLPYADPIETHWGCFAGDKGGPAFAIVDDQTAVVGVMQSGFKQACYEEAEIRFVAFDKGAIPGGISNWDWLHKTFEEICTKQVKMGVAPAPGMGIITGSISPTQLYPDEKLENNDVMYCDGSGSDDCVENIHSATIDGRPDQEIVLNASPANGYQFVEWLSGSTKCPCEGATDPTCVLPYQYVGTYTETVSDDVSFCIAKFDAKACEPPTVQTLSTNTGGPEIPIILDPLAIDSDPNQLPLSIKGIGGTCDPESPPGPRHGTVSINEDNTLTYTQTDNCSAGDSFFVEVTNGNCSSCQQVQIVPGCPLPDGGPETITLTYGPPVGQFAVYGTACVLPVDQPTTQTLSKAAPCVWQDAHDYPVSFSLKSDCSWEVNYDAFYVYYQTSTVWDGTSPLVVPTTMDECGLASPSVTVMPGY